VPRRSPTSRPRPESSTLRIANVSPTTDGSTRTIANASPTIGNVSPTIGNVSPTIGNVSPTTGGSTLPIANVSPTLGDDFWECSSDQEHCFQLPDTHQATTTLTGLTPGQTYYFRYRTLKGKVKGDFSAVLSFMVT
jgi:hypothetical protein